MTYRRIGAFAAILIMGALLGGCGNKQEVSPQQEVSSAATEESTSTPAQDILSEVTGSFIAVPGEYIVEPRLSRIQWEGKGVGKSHVGTIALDSGSITVGPVAIDSGTLVMDMSSIQAIDNSPFDVISHLKSPDFFDVEQYPKSTFVLTGMQRTGDHSFIISGNLTIKQETYTILFPAFVKKIENGYHATAAFSIDRTRWGIRYGSNNFFDNLGDKAIDDMIYYEINVTALLADDAQK